MLPPATAIRFLRSLLLKREEPPAMVNILLNDERNDQHVLSEKNEGEMSNIFDLESEIATKAASVLVTALTSEEIMKTLKFFLTCFVVITFFGLASYSQGNVKKIEYLGEDLVNYQLPGLTETAPGSYSGCLTYRNFKYLWRAEGTFTGDDSGNKYYTSYFETYNYPDWMPGSVVTGVGTIHIKDEQGKVCYTTHYPCCTSILL